jgi:deazaflavin-dependent oxidoreductase (nitroreductase family)
MAATRNVFVEVFWKIHPALYRWTRGRLGGSMMNMPVLLLTTTGRKTAAARTNALTYLPAGERYVVIASVLGEPHHPAWWLNLRANPQATIQVRDRTIPVVARETDGAERERFWNEVVGRQPDYAEYQRRTTRRIPVVLLEPRG